MKSDDEKLLQQLSMLAKEGLSPADKQELKQNIHKGMGNLRAKNPHKSRSDSFGNRAMASKKGRKLNKSSISGIAAAVAAVVVVAGGFYVVSNDKSVKQNTTAASNQTIPKVEQPMQSVSIPLAQGNSTPLLNFEVPAGWTKTKVGVGDSGGYAWTNPKDPKEVVQEIVSANMSAMQNFQTKQWDVTGIFGGKSTVNWSNVATNKLTGKFTDTSHLNPFSAPPESNPNTAYGKAFIITKPNPFYVYVEVFGPKSLGNRIMSTVQLDQSGASSTSSTQATPSLRTVDMINNTTGWGTDGTSIWYTTDSAVHWANITPSGMNSTVHWPVQLFARDSGHAWLAVPQNTKNSIMIYRTSNGGKSWSATKIGDMGNITSFDFSDQSHGWLLVQKGGSMGKDKAVIYQTSDGGMTWKKLSVTNDVHGGTLPYLGTKTGATFINEKDGWLTGYTAAHGSIYLYRTTDGGQSWAQQQISLPSKLKQDRFASQPPIFFNKKDGILPVEIFGGPMVIYRTGNGGATWTPTRPVSSKVVGAPGQEGVFDFPSMNFGISTDGNKVFTTTDGGQTWSSFTPNIPLKQVSKLKFTSSKDGWALIQLGTLYRTTDGGHTWIKANSLQQ